MFLGECDEDDSNYNYDTAISNGEKPRKPNVRRVARLIPISAAEWLSIAMQAGVA